MKDEQEYTEIFSPHEEGITIKAETIAEAEDRSEAEAIFQAAKERLLSVNQWHRLAGKALAHFQLTDQHGQAIDGPVYETCHFKIDIPGPGTEEGQGFDWVRVERIIEHSQSNTQGIAIQVIPSPNPLKESKVTAHFYSSESTSIFAVMIQGDKVIASVYDINLKPNRDSGGAVDQIRNTIIGAAGILGLSKLQWQRLTDGLLNQND